jgi:hypothetical protein
MKGLPLDWRAGLVLSLIDGRSTVEMIVDMAAAAGLLTLNRGYDTPPTACCGRTRKV